MSDDELYSDLTSIEDSDDEREKKPKKKSKSSFHRVLPKPRACNYTASSLYEQISQGDIDLDPEYQRNVVWGDAKQIQLIDSIFRNFYIPPIIFTVTTEDGEEKRTCIDGKQRLTSLHRFMDGQIYPIHRRTGEKYWYKDVGGTSKNRVARKLLPEKYRKSFAKKQIVCVEYDGIDDTEEREIFQRVQMGMALTPSEKLAVIDTPRSRFIRSLLEKYLTESGALASPPLEWDRSRGSDFRTLSLAVYVIERFLDDPVGFRQLPAVEQLSRWLSAREDVPSSVQSTIISAFDEFSAIVRTPAHKHIFRTPNKMAPIEVAMFAVLVAAHPDKPRAEVADLMQALRVDVRARHEDVRSNGKVTRTILDFIHVSRGGKAGSGPRKRGRQVKKEQDDDDPEYQPGSSKRTKTASARKAAPAEDEEMPPAPRPPPVKKPKPLPRPEDDVMARLREAREGLKQPISAPTPHPQPPSGLPSPPLSAMAGSETPTPVIGGIPLEAMMMAQSYGGGMSGYGGGGFHGGYGAPGGGSGYGGNGYREDRRDPRDFRRR
ncbi:hypothetical protein HDZ31DRAFT_37920 [Schizophyllum fasciatum]